MGRVDYPDAFLGHVSDLYEVFSHVPQSQSVPFTLTRSGTDPDGSVSISSIQDTVGTSQQTSRSP